MWRPVVPPQANPAAAWPLTCLNSLPRSRWRRQPRPAGRSPCPRSCSPSGCRSRRPPKPSRSCGRRRAAQHQQGSCHPRGQREAVWRLPAAPQSPRWHGNPRQPRSPPAAHPGRFPWQPRLSRGIKWGDKEGTRLRTLPAGQEAVAGLVPRVPRLRSLLGAAGKVPELQRPRSPPRVPGSFPKFPLALGTPKEEPGSLPDTQLGLPKLRGGRRALRPARGHSPEFPRAGTQPRGQRDLPGRSSRPWSGSRPAPAPPRHRRDGTEGLRLPGAAPERRGRRQRGSAEAT